MKLRAAAYVLVLLLGSAHAVRAHAAENPYHAELTSIQQKLEAGTSGPEAALLLARAAELRELVDDADALAQWFETVAGDARHHRLVRDHAARYAAQESLHRGDLKSADARWTELGFVRQWRVLGPFPGLLDLDAELGPETGLGVAAEYRDRAGRPLHWQPAPPAGPQAGLELTDTFGEPGAAVAYLTTSIHVDRDTPVAVRIGSDAALALWVNGARMLTEREERRAAFDQYAAGAVLRRGWNVLLVKLRRSGEGSWQFDLRLTAPEGGGLTLETSIAPEHLGISSASPEPVAIADLRTMAAAAATDAQGLERMARIEALQSAGAPVETMQRAVAQQPTAERWLFLARQYRGTVREGTALDLAMNLGPQHAPARVAAASYYASRQQHEKAFDLLREALRLAPDDFVARKRMADLFATAGDKQRAATELLALAKDYPRPLWIKRQLATHYERSGEVQKALALASELLRKNFDHAHDRALRLRLLERGNDREAMLAAYAELAALYPSYAVPRERMAELRGTAGEPEVRPASDPDTPYLVDVEEELRKVWAALPAETTVLAEVRVQRVRENGLDEVRTQQLLYIATAEAAREHAFRAVQYSPESESLRVLRARVHKKDGRTLEALEAGETQVSEPGISMYYDLRARNLHFRGLQAGDVLELDHRVEPTVRNNPYGDYFGEVVHFGGAVPLRLKRYVLISPPGRTLEAHQARMGAPDISLAEEQVVRRWELRDVAAVTLEPRGPAATELVPYVHVSTFGSWQELGRWYAAFIAPQFALDVRLRELARDLTRDTASGIDKVHAIHRYVLRNTHYVALEFGTYSYKPYAVTDVHARRFGDCKDKAALMIALLRAAGVDAEMALVRTRRLGEIAGAPASMAVFNHAVVYVPGYDLWLDGTAEYAGSRELPLDDQGAMAVTVAADGRTALRRLPRSAARDNVTRREVRAQLHPNGAITFTVNNQVRGEDAPGLRREYEAPERQLEVARGRLAEVFPAVQVEDVLVDGADDLEHDVRVEVRGKLETFVGQRQVSLPASWEPRQYVQALAPLLERSQPLLLPAAWTTEEQMAFALPRRARVVGLPRDVSIASSFGAASISFSLREATVVVSTSVQFTRTRVEPEEYAEFRAFCRRVEDAFRSEIQVALR